MSCAHHIWINCQLVKLKYACSLSSQTNLQRLWFGLPVLTVGLLLLFLYDATLLIGQFYVMRSVFKDEAQA